MRCTRRTTRVRVVLLFPIAYAIVPTNIHDAFFTSIRSSTLALHFDDEYHALHPFTSLRWL